MNYVRVAASLIMLLGGTLTWSPFVQKRAKQIGEGCCNDTKRESYILNTSQLDCDRSIYNTNFMKSQVSVVLLALSFWWQGAPLLNFAMTSQRIVGFGNLYTGLSFYSDGSKAPLEVLAQFYFSALESTYYFKYLPYMVSTYRVLPMFSLDLRVIVLWNMTSKM